MLDPASVLDFSCTNDFYFIRRTGRGLWHIRPSGAIPGVCYCGKISLNELDLEPLGIVSIRNIYKKCLVLYVLESFQ